MDDWNSTNEEYDSSLSYSMPESLFMRNAGKYAFNNLVLFQLLGSEEKFHGSWTFLLCL